MRVEEDKEKKQQQQRKISELKGACLRCTLFHRLLPLFLECPPRCLVCAGGEGVYVPSQRQKKAQTQVLSPTFSFPLALPPIIHSPHSSTVRVYISRLASEPYRFLAVANATPSHQHLTRFSLFTCLGVRMCGYRFMFFSYSFEKDFPDLSRSSVINFSYRPPPLSVCPPHHY